MAMLNQMPNLVSPLQSHYSIYYASWYWNSNRIVAVNWADDDGADDKLPLVPLADAFEMYFSALFW